MKKSRKLLVGSLILVLIMAISIVFSGCGGGPSTLEEYIASDSTAQEQIDSLSTGGMDVDITGNTLTYTYTYSQTFDDDTVNQIKPQIENIMSSQGSTFESISKTLEEESGIEGITVKVVYLDGAGTELYSGEF